MIKLIGLFIALTLSNPAYANIQKLEDNCLQNGVNLCHIATAMTEQLTPHLPIQINELLSMESAKAMRNSVVVVMRFHQGKGDAFREALRDLDDKGEAVKDIVVSRITKDGCRDENSAEFIMQGGIITYKFIFSDGEAFSSVSLTECLMN